MTKFNELGLAEPLLRAVSAEGYKNPTPIQADVIPLMLQGRDVLGTAQTGTGKTAGFVLPLLHRIATGGKRPAPKQCAALILAPTRELAQQIAVNIRTYGRHVRHSVAVIVGGVNPRPQIKAVSNGVDIIVATPGRLLDHMATGAIRLEGTKTIVLDEADQMMDLGFMPAIRKVMAKLPKERQNVLMSATMPKPIRALANDFLKNPAEVAVAAQSTPIEKIDQVVIHVNGQGKRDALIDILREQNVDRGIVFTRTKRGADKVSQGLEKAGFANTAIHGNKSQNQRERTLAGFKKGKVKILVATDIAARGIDVDEVSHVINYDLPNVPEAYVHRIGRTARAGRSGIAIALCDHSEQKLLRDIEKLIGYKLAANGAPVRQEKTGQRSGGHAQRVKAKKAEKAEKAKQAEKKRKHRNSRKRQAGTPHAPKQADTNKFNERTPGNEKADAGLSRMMSNADGGQKRGGSRTEPIAA